MDRPEGYFLLVLHAHLPFIRHPEHEEFLHESWFFDALDETYYPLLAMCERLQHDDIPFTFCLSLSPPLCEMFVDPFLQERYLQHLDRIENLLDRESDRVNGTEFDSVVNMYRERYAAIRRLQEQWDNPLQGFCSFQKSGQLELITCPGTHPILPFCATENGRRAHIKVSIRNYEKHMGCRPKGMWLPECAYDPGMEAIIGDHAIEYFFIAANGVLFASPRPRGGVHAPVSCANGVAAFAGDMEISPRLWTLGPAYATDPAYREFSRDLGFDAEYCYIRPFLQQDGIRRNLGLKYHRIDRGVPLKKKGVYRPSVARERVNEHVADFVSTVQARVRDLAGSLGQPPVIVAAYSAELFGHWWFEGPAFLENLFRRLAKAPKEVMATTPSRYLAQSPEIQIVQPAQSACEEGGYLDRWLNDKNDWIYRHLHKAEERMVELTRLHPEANGLLRRALNQGARELLLAQSSDWAFVMDAEKMTEYAEKRTRDHVHNLNGIYLQIVEDRLENGWIAELEARNTIFQEMDYRVFL